MSATEPIPVCADKVEKRQEMANSFPRAKNSVSRVSSSPVSGDTASFGAEIRRRSDNFFNSYDTFCEEVLNERPRASTLSLERGRKASESSNNSPDSDNPTPRIDAWLKWRKDRRHSSPNISVNKSQVGSPV